MFHTQEKLYLEFIPCTSQQHEILKGTLEILDAVTDPDGLVNDLSSVDLISGPVADTV